MVERDLRRVHIDEGEGDGKGDFSEGTLGKVQVKGT